MLRYLTSRCIIVEIHKKTVLLDLLLYHRPIISHEPLYISSGYIHGRVSVGIQRYS